MTQKEQDEALQSLQQVPEVVQDDEPNELLESPKVNLSSLNQLTRNQRSYVLNESIEGG